MQFNFAELRSKYAVVDEESNPQQFVSTKNLAKSAGKPAAGRSKQTRETRDGIV